MASLRKDELAAIASIMGVGGNGTVAELIIKIRHRLVALNMVQPSSKDDFLFGLSGGSAISDLTA